MIIITGKIVDIGDVVELKYANKPSFLKRMLLISFGNRESIYCEIGNSRLKYLQEPTPILIGDKVEVHIKFVASEKSLKRYNNLIVQKIIKL